MEVAPQGLRPYDDSSCRPGLYTED